jgi:hypothetical protein
MLFGRCEDSLISHLLQVFLTKFNELAGLELNSLSTYDEIQWSSFYSGEEKSKTWAVLFPG